MSKPASVSDEAWSEFLKRSKERQEEMRERGSDGGA